VPPILDLANASIRHNQRQYEKLLAPVRRGGERPWQVATATPELQGTWVADQLLALREEGFDLEQMAVLYRNHAHSLELQVELTRRNIPYRVRSGLRFFEQRHVKDVLAHLRFVDNPRDEVAFARAIKLRPGFGPRLASRIWSQITGRSPLDALLALDARAVSLPRAAAAALTELQTMLGALSAPRTREAPGEAVRAVVDGFYREWARDNLDNAGARLDDLEQLALFADGYPDVTAFLAEITLLNELSGEDMIGGPPDEMVTLSTAHQAKGLEWRVVFVIWLSEGRFPTVRAEDEEEERRLFYVSVTRARDRLFLVHPEVARDRYRVDVLLDPSRFLSELPSDVVEPVLVRPPKDELALPELGSGRYDLPSFLLPDGDDDDDSVH
jgi:DNA helicase-2/ATP-dependent DNA helicase PcrA